MADYDLNFVGPDQRIALAAAQRAEDAGDALKLLLVQATPTQVTYDGSGAASPSTQTVTFSTIKRNTTAVVSWTITDLAGNSLTPVTNYLSASTGDSVTMLRTAFDAARGSTKGVIVTASATDVVAMTSSATVVAMRDGTVSAITGLLAECAAAASSNTTLSGIQNINGQAGSDGMRVLLTAQTAGAENGPWVMHSGAWTRPTDFDSSAEAITLVGVLVTNGTNAGLYQLVTAAPITLGTTALTWNRSLLIGDSGVTLRGKARRATKVTEREPYPTDDGTAGYSTGDLWQMRDGRQFMCQSITTGNAAWTKTDASNQPLNDDTLPLDRITGASLAFAPFKLRSAYAGNCFQVKRTDTTTLDIGFVWNSDLKLYVADWAAVDAFIAGSQAWYSKIYDQSGNGYDLTATSFVPYINSPTSNTRNAINGLRTISFWGGTRTEMAIPVGHSVSRQNCTIISAGLVSSSGHANAICELGNDASYLNRLLLTTISRQGIIQPIGNTNLLGPRLESSAHVQGASFGSSAVNYMCNDTVATSGALSAQTLTGGFVGSANGGGYTYWGDYAAFIVYPTALSTANMQILRQSLTRFLRIQPQCRDRLIPIGDSITVAADGAVQPWWRQALPRLDRDYQVFNNALEGDTAVAATPFVSSQVTAAVRSGVTNVVAYAYGTNDLAALSATNGDAANATTVQTRIQSHCAAIRSANPSARIVVATILPRNNSFTGGQTDASFEASRLLVNAWLRANYPTFADAIADYGGDSYIGQHANVTDATWMNGNLHPKERGHGIMAAWEIPAINGLG